MFLFFLYTIASWCFTEGIFTYLVVALTAYTLVEDTRQENTHTTNLKLEAELET